MKSVQRLLFHRLLPARVVVPARGAEAGIGAARAPAVALLAEGAIVPVLARRTVARPALRVPQREQCRLELVFGDLAGVIPVEQRPEDPSDRGGDLLNLDECVELRPGEHAVHPGELLEVIVEGVNVELF